MKTIHLAQMGAAAGTVRAIIGRGMDGVVEAQDILSIGPLGSGPEIRRAWIRNLGIFVDPDDEIFRDVGLCLTRREVADASRLVVWTGGNADEQLLLRAVADLGSDLMVIDVSSAMSGGDPPLCVGECSPDELREAFSCARVLSEVTRAELCADWQRIQSEPYLVRVFDKGRIVGHDEDFYDGLLLDACPEQFTVAARVVGEAMGKSFFPVGDVFMAYRLRHLVNIGAMEIRNADKPLWLMEVRRTLD